MQQKLLPIHPNVSKANHYPLLFHDHDLHVCVLDNPPPKKITWCEHATLLPALLLNTEFYGDYAKAYVFLNMVVEGSLIASTLRGLKIDIGIVYVEVRNL